MAYCIAMLLMFLKVFRMEGTDILNLSSRNFIDGMCVAALAPAVLYSKVIIQGFQSLQPHPKKSS